MLSEQTMIKYIFLFLFGGMTYYFCEIGFRGYSHYSMIICGGLCFVCCGLLDQGAGAQLPFFVQMVLSAVIITAFELVTGIIVNVWMHLEVWDYSMMPFNYKGQICLSYSMLWMLLSIICIVADDGIRHFIFDEPVIKYHLY